MTVTLPPHLTCTPFSFDCLQQLHFKAAIFDFDGTLADSLGVWRRVDEMFFQKRGLELTPDYGAKLSLLGFADGARYTKETFDLDDTVEAICQEWNDMADELYRTEVRLRPGAQDALERLHALAMPVGMATTNAPEVIDAMQPRVPIDRLLPVRVHGREVAHPTKDCPDIYAECARRLGVETGDCIVFEDLPVGLQSARKLGMTCVGVLNDMPDQDVRALVQASDFMLADWRQI